VELKYNYEKALRNIHAFEKVFDIEVARAGKGKLIVTITSGGQQKKYMINENTTNQIVL
jgi:hypothetical protein